MSGYIALEQRFRRISALRDAQGVLHWDMSTMMPEGGAEARSEQLAALEVTCHELISDPAMTEFFEEALEEAQGLGVWERANLREMRRRWLHETALEARLVEALTRAGNSSEMIWRRARANGDFAAVRPALEELLGLVREAATAKSEVFGCSRYDALLDEYEPGGASATIDRIFDDLAAFLPDFLERVLTRQKAAPAPLPLEGPFPVDRQRALGRRLMEIVGFDFAHGRLDTSLHPFCGGVPDDVRITTRYDEADFAKSLMGVLHETGHALYDRGLPKKWRGQPVGDACGMAIHESQSLLVEMQACRSPEFVRFMAPHAREVFGGGGAAWEADNLIRIYNRVRPGFIRVDADEVTYPAHVILRYRLEKAMIDGDLRVGDLPGAWNEGMRRLLGIQPPDDRLGCLQDIHWYDGAWGYFPTYTLGAMAAAQIYAAAKAAVPEIPAAIERGDFAPLMSWLGKNVHAHGSFYKTEDLIAHATGRPLDPKIFEAHLTERYLHA